MVSMEYSATQKNPTPDKPLDPERYGSCGSYEKLTRIIRSLQISAENDGRSYLPEYT